MALKPWYKVVVPREDLRQGRPLDASEFAVHLDKVRDGTAPEDYRDARRFFERTYLTASLVDLGAQMLRRLSGITTETSAVFNMATQFGGGKTHALTLLYHLATCGRKAEKFAGVDRLLDRAGVDHVPKAAVAVFVGTEFDSTTGRGGEDGTPLRKTPWGEIAWQLGSRQAFAKVAEHERRFVEPKGDVIRAFLPKDKPCLILMDEIISYVSTYRKYGYHNCLYNFIQARALKVRARDVNCAFKFFRRTFFEKLELKSDGFLIDAELYARADRAGLRWLQAPVRHRPRVRGTTSIHAGTVGETLRELRRLKKMLG